MDRVEDNGMEKGQEKGGGFSNILIIILLVVAIGAGSGYFLLSHLSASENNTKKVEQPGPTLSLGDFLVNLFGLQAYQYIKATVVVEVNNRSVIDELKQRSPQMRDCIIAILRETKQENIEKPDTKKIKQNIKQGINDLLTSGKVTDVWFTQFVVQ